jgi:hypothetical protein
MKLAKKKFLYERSELNFLANKSKVGRQVPEP